MDLGDSKESLIFFHTISILVIFEVSMFRFFFMFFANLQEITHDRTCAKQGSPCPYSDLFFPAQFYPVRLVQLRLFQQILPIRTEPHITNYL